MSRRDGLFALFAVAMAAVTWTARLRQNAAPDGVRQNAAAGELRVTTAWLVERETAVGDWVPVRPPLTTGDEVQLTVRSDEDAFIYVVSDSDGRRSVVFPPEGAAPELARIHAGWAYAVPAPHRSWRLDGAAHDRLLLIAARRPLYNPVAALDAARAATRTRDAGALVLPLRDGRRGQAPSRVLFARDVVVDELVLR